MWGDRFWPAVQSVLEHALTISLRRIFWMVSAQVCGVASAVAKVGDFNEALAAASGEVAPSPQRGSIQKRPAGSKAPNKRWSLGHTYAHDI